MAATMMKAVAEKVSIMMTTSCSITMAFKKPPCAKVQWMNLATTCSIRWKKKHRLRSQWASENWAPSQKWSKHQQPNAPKKWCPIVMIHPSRYENDKWEMIKNVGFGELTEKILFSHLTETIEEEEEGNQQRRGRWLHRRWWFRLRLRVSGTGQTNDYPTTLANF